MEVLFGPLTVLKTEYAWKLIPWEVDRVLVLYEKGYETMIPSSTRFYREWLDKFERVVEISIDEPNYDERAIKEVKAKADDTWMVLLNGTDTKMKQFIEKIKIEIIRSHDG